MTTQIEKGAAPGVVGRDWRDDYVCCVHVMALEHPASTDGVRHQGFVIWRESCYASWVDAGRPDKPTEMPCFKGADE